MHTGTLQGLCIPSTKSLMHYPHHANVYTRTSSTVTTHRMYPHHANYGQTIDGQHLRLFCSEIRSSFERPVWGSVGWGGGREIVLHQIDVSAYWNISAE